MAETDTGAAPQTEIGARELVINAQYIKDLSFENPHAPHSLMRMQQQAPEVAMGIDVNATTLAPDVYEVLMTIHAEAKSGNDRIFLVELTYAGVATVTNVAEADMPRALLVEAPKLLFPFARAVIANATRDGGFMPLLMNTVDFTELLKQRQAAAAAAGTGPVTV